MLLIRLSASGSVNARMVWMDLLDATQVAALLGLARRSSITVYRSRGTPKLVRAERCVAQQPLSARSRHSVRSDGSTDGHGDPATWLAPSDLFTRPARFLQHGGCCVRQSGTQRGSRR
jgi:hypothetical protein